MRKISVQTVLGIATGALALNAMLWGLFAFDAVAWLSGGALTMISRIVQGVLGFAALALVFGLSRRRRLEEEQEEEQEREQNPL